MTRDILANVFNSRIYMHMLNNAMSNIKMKKFFKKYDFRFEILFRNNLIVVVIQRNLIDYDISSFSNRQPM